MFLIASPRSEATLIILIFFTDKVSILGSIELVITKFFNLEFAILSQAFPDKTP